jgi:hypothetical protein
MDKMSKVSKISGIRTIGDQSQDFLRQWYKEKTKDRKTIRKKKVKRKKRYVVDTKA